jgi:hypothetical protein
VHFAESTHGPNGINYWNPTPARILWRLVRAAQEVVPWHVACDFRTSFHPNVQGNPASDVNFDAVFARHNTEPPEHARRFPLLARARPRH